MHKPAIGFFLALFVLLFSGAVLAWPATVHHVADGDTVTVIRTATGEKFRVRMAGYDAPEVSHGRGQPSQAFGQASKKYFAGLLGRGRVGVHPNGTRSYDRIVATITVDGLDVGQRMVKAGMAWNYARYAPDYAQAQAQAKRQHKGLWRDANPTPPWQWRHQEKR